MTLDNQAVVSRAIAICNRLGELSEDDRTRVLSAAVVWALLDLPAARRAAHVEAHLYGLVRLGEFEEKAA